MYFQIDSRDRVSGTLTDFVVDLKNFPTSNRFNRVSLMSFSLPKTYYLIDDDTDEFTVTEDGKNATVTLGHGNYSLQQLAAQMQTKLRAVSPHSLLYSVSGNETTGKYEFSVTDAGGNPPAFQPDFTFTQSLAIVLGFEEDTYSFTADALTSPNVVKLQRTDTVLVWSDLVESSDGILHQVNASGIGFSHIIYQAQDVEWFAKKLTTRGNSAAHFRILYFEEPRHVIDLNGHHVHMTVALWEASPLQAMQIRDLQVSALQARLRLDTSTRILRQLEVMTEVLQEQAQGKRAKTE